MTLFRWNLRNKSGLFTWIKSIQNMSHKNHIKTSDLFRKFDRKSVTYKYQKNRDEHHVFFEIFRHRIFRSNLRNKSGIIVSRTSQMHQFRKLVHLRRSWDNDLKMAKFESCSTNRWNAPFSETGAFEMFVRQNKNYHFFLRYCWS